MFSILFGQKSRKDFESSVEEAITKFGKYKDINYFSNTVVMDSNLYQRMVAYLTKYTLYYDLQKD